jgi:hypothetical protein
MHKREVNYFKRDEGGKRLSVLHENPQKSGSLQNHSFKIMFGSFLDLL